MTSWLRFDNRHTAIATVLALTSSLLFVALVTHLPVAILAGAGHDDAWFWLRARAITSGSWMGGYDQYTLMKGSGYPLFLAINRASGLSLMTSQALLYSVACLLLGAAIYRISGRAWLSLLLVLAMQWHPMALAWARVVRDNIAAGQALLALACLLHLLFVPHPSRRAWLWTALSGWALAWMWTTREDGIWILPGMAVLLLLRGLQVWRNRGERRRLAVGGLLVALVFAGWLTLVATANGIKYGEFATVDVKESAYKDAISALQRVRVGEPVPYVPVPQKVREAVYVVSPAFARLRPGLEDTLRHWTKPGCAVYAQTCDDYAGGWFMWALRDAVAGIGGYASASEADAFYRQLADEIGRACDDGRLRCVRSAIGLMPPVTGAQWRTMPTRLRSAVAVLVWRDARQGRRSSHVSHPAVGEMWSFLGKPRVPDGAGALGDWVVGWFYDPQGRWIRGRCASHSEAIDIARHRSPDIVAHFNDPEAGNNRFKFKFPAAEGCAIEFTSGDGVVQLFEVTETTRHFTFGSGQLYLDSVSAGTGIPPAARAPAWSVSIKHAIGKGYALVLPWLAGSGLLAFLWVSGRVIRRRRSSPLYAVAAASWCMVACRAVLLALVDMSAFPALNVQYMQAAFPLLVLAAIASLALLVDRDVLTAARMAKPAVQG
jgi:hypothetical protein